MVKCRQNCGFTLMEMIIVIAVASVLLSVAFPAVERYLSQQRLKQSASHITSFIQSARSMASSTECPTQLILRNANGGLQLSLNVLKRNKWRGCLRWFEARGSASVNAVTISNLSIVSVQLVQGSQTLGFEAVSGAPEGTAAQSIRLIDRGQTTTIQINGIGNGTLQ